MSTSMPQSIVYPPNSILNYKGVSARLISLQYNGTGWVAITDPRNYDIEQTITKVAVSERFGNPSLQSIQASLDKKG